MGAWGYQPWDNDAAADWFGTLWKGSDFSIVINEIMNFDVWKEEYDSFRAASYVLQVLGNPYMWPSEHLDVLKDLLDRSISVLENMVDPPSDAWRFVEDWDDEVRIVESLRAQIAALRKRRSEIA